MNAMVNRRPGSATFSGVRLAPTLAPRALNSIARNCASGFKGEKVSLVYRFVYSATSERQSSCSLGSQKLTATHAAAPAASSPMAMPPPALGGRFRRSALTAGERRGPGVAGRAGAQAELVRAASRTRRRLAGQPPAIRRTAGAVAHPPPDAPRGRFFDLRRVRCRSTRQVRRHPRAYNFACPSLLFGFASAARPADSLLMIVPIGTQ